jgi:hypothetical protein
MASPKSEVPAAAADNPPAPACRATPRAGKTRAFAAGPLVVGVLAVGCVCYAANTLTARWAVEAAPEAVASAPAFVAPEWVTADGTAAPEAAEAPEPPTVAPGLPAPVPVTPPASASVAAPEAAAPAHHGGTCADGTPSARCAACESCRREAAADAARTAVTASL